MNTNVASWISNFPSFEPIITNPETIAFFEKFPCPNNVDKKLAEEWNQIVKQIGPLDPGSENLIGDLP